MKKLFFSTFAMAAFAVATFAQTNVPITVNKDTGRLVAPTNAFHANITNTDGSIIIVKGANGRLTISSVGGGGGAGSIVGSTNKGMGTAGANGVGLGTNDNLIVLLSLVAGNNMTITNNGTNIFFHSAITSGGGIENLNGQVGVNQTFSASSSGSDFAIVSSGNNHDFRLPNASTTSRGALQSADYIMFIAKQTGSAILSNIVANGGAITNLNGLTGGNQTLAVGTSGSDIAWSSSGSTHTLNVPTASASARGAVSAADYASFTARQGGSLILSNITALSGNGFIARTGSGTVANRTMMAANNKLSISDGDGVSGNPTFGVNENNLDLGAMGGLLDGAKVKTNAIGLTGVLPPAGTFPYTAWVVDGNGVPTFGKVASNMFTPPGSDMQVTFNSTGLLAAVTGVTIDRTNASLTATGSLNSPVVAVTGAGGGTARFADSDASHYMAIKANPTTTTSGAMWLPSSPAAGALSVTLDNGTNMVMTIGAAGGGGGETNAQYFVKTSTNALANEIEITRLEYGFIPLLVTSAIFPTTNQAKLDLGWDKPELQFNKANAEGVWGVPVAARWGFILPVDYKSNTLQVRINSTITTTNWPNQSNVIFRVSLKTVHPGSNVDIHSGGFGTAVSVTNLWAADATQSNLVQVVVASLTNVTSGAQAGSSCVLKIDRDSSNDGFGGTSAIVDVQPEYIRQ